MSYLNHLQIAVLFCFGMVLTIVIVPVSSAQEDLEADATITLDVDEILGESDEEDVTLSRLVDKSTISDLEFLNAGDSPTSIDQLKAMQEHVASLYQRIEPAVVNIRSGMGQGSGVVVSGDGYILTAAHVIAIPNRSAIITFPDGSQARAQTLGMFRTLDAGLLKIYAMVPPEEQIDEDASDEDESDEEEDSEEEDSEDEDSEEEDSEDEDSESEEDKDSETETDEESDEEMSDDEQEEEPESDDESDEEDEDEADDDETNEDEIDEDEEPDQDRFAVQEDLPSFNYLEIGDSGSLNLGQWVIAVGHPGGLDEDRGIVLRVGRINKIAADTAAANFQTDCTLVGGDSGGPLIGMDGSVLGIHSRIGMGLRDNFHVPANDFVNNWTEMLNPVVHDRDPMTAIVFRGRTNVIKRIPRISMSARSGLKANDRIIRVGEKDVFDQLQFDDAISDLKPYQKVEFEVHRKGKKKVINVTIGEKQERGRR